MAKLKITRWFNEAASVDLESRTAKVVIISEGLGNLKDKNFYTASAVRSAARVFEGKRFFVDHPSRSEEDNRPERSVRDLAGYFYETSVGTVEDPETGEDLAACFAKLKFSNSEPGNLALGQVMAALEYQRRFPKSKDVFCGISINGGGTSVPDEIKGIEVNRVDEIVEAFSADIVTMPARGGKFLSVISESIKAADAKTEKWREAYRSRREKQRERERKAVLPIKSFIDDVKRKLAIKSVMPGGDAQDMRKRKASEALPGLKAAIASFERQYNGLGSDQYKGSGPRTQDPVSMTKARGQRGKLFPTLTDAHHQRDLQKRRAVAARRRIKVAKKLASKAAKLKLAEVMNVDQYPTFAAWHKAFRSWAHEVANLQEAASSAAASPQLRKAISPKLKREIEEMVADALEMLKQLKHKHEDEAGGPASGEIASLVDNEEAGYKVAGRDVGMRKGSDMYEAEDEDEADRDDDDDDDDDDLDEAESAGPGEGTDDDDPWRSEENFRYASDPMKSCSTCDNFDGRGGCTKFKALVRGVDTCDSWEEC